MAIAASSATTLLRRFARISAPKPSSWSASKEHDNSEK